MFAPFPPSPLKGHGAGLVQPSPTFLHFPLPLSSIANRCAPRTGRVKGFKSALFARTGHISFISRLVASSNPHFTVVPGTISTSSPGCPIFFDKMNFFLLLLTAGLASATPVTVGEARTAPAAFLPAVLVPYAAAISLVVVPLLKSFLVQFVKLLNLPLEAIAMLYLVFYLTVFMFPGLASLLKMTETLSAKALEEGSRAMGASSWLKGLLPPWIAEVTTLFPQTGDSMVNTSSATTSTMTTAAAYTTTTAPSSSTTVTTTTAKSAAPRESAQAPGPACLSFQVCQSVSKLMKDYPMSVMLMTYLG